MNNILEYNSELTIASHWSKLENNNKVQCNLCPRHCRLKSGMYGICGVRMNQAGNLYTLNYGVSVSATVEVIETEAVYHFGPGTNILSLGNLGCNMKCDFCQNWETSQMINLDNFTPQIYTPQEIIHIAKEFDIHVISWTYNDPVVWHEFVIETSKLARDNNIFTLFKSALYLEELPVKELIEVIDIFSISLKSLNSDFYTKNAKADLEPILKRIELINKSNRHLEISQLIVTGRNDQVTDIQNTITWILKHVGVDIPLHFVGFHPAYKYLNSSRTSFEVIYNARQMAIEQGIKYCYLGNTYKNEVSDTFCKKCNNLLVKRVGLSTSVIGIDKNGFCNRCNEVSPIKMPHLSKDRKVISPSSEANLFDQSFNFYWTENIKSLHIILDSSSHKKACIKVKHIPSNEVKYIYMSTSLHRVMVTCSCESESEVEISHNKDVNITLLPILDRAHYPINIAGE